MRVLVLEKRKFNWVILGLLAATIAIWAAWMLQTGTFTTPL